MRISAILLFLMIPAFSVAQHAPEIVFLSVSDLTPLAWTQELVIKLSYFDPDGDLGENKAGVRNLFVTDNRTGLLYSFRVRQLLPEDKNGSIKGILEVIINYVPVFNLSGPPEIFNYNLMLMDRAGNKSNIVFTDSIKVTP